MNYIRYIHAFLCSKSSKFCTSLVIRKYDSPTSTFLSVRVEPDIRSSFYPVSVLPGCKCRIWASGYRIKQFLSGKNCIRKDPAFNAQVSLPSFKMARIHPLALIQYFCYWTIWYCYISILNVDVTNLQFKPLKPYIW